MNLSTTSTHSLQLQLAEIEKQLIALDNQLCRLPEGSASISESAGRIRMTGMYQGKRRTYNRQELPLVKQLLMRKYLTKKKHELEHAKTALKHYVSYATKWMGSASQFLMDNPRCASLLEDEFTSSDKPFHQWAARPDCCAAPYQEKRTEKTLFGLNVRSKSEVMIATYLFEIGIPFRYEEPLHLGQSTYYPDFTLRDPKSGSFIWYEHFGRMDDPEYIRRNYGKLATYAAHGIVPSINLIITYETQAHKLNLPQIAAAVETVV